MISYLIEKIINLLGFEFSFDEVEFLEHFLMDLIIIFTIFLFIFFSALILKLGGC